MSIFGSMAGINLVSLQDAFSGSEDILTQMLALFDAQARERMAQLKAALAEWDVAAARQYLHSLVNISGAVHAYAMSELAKALTEAVKNDDRSMAELLFQALDREADLVLRQTGLLLAALAKDHASAWEAVLPE